MEPFHFAKIISQNKDFFEKICAYKNCLILFFMANKYRNRLIFSACAQIGR